MILTTLAILGFVLIQLGIGYWASRRIAHEDDYLVAGRRLGPWVAGFSLFVTWFGAESILGSSAAIHEDGLAGGRADPFGYAFSLLLFGVFFAARLWRTGSMTLADVYRSRFGRTTERVAAFVLIPPSVLWSAAQIRALGQILSFQTPIGLEVAIVLATVIAVLYTYVVALASSATAKYVFAYEAPFLLSLGLSIVVFLMLAPLDFRNRGQRMQSC